ncbi:MAG: AI-2E family transporter [Lachnospiraceae bacterium]|nr:AI-2E family transporter [Lachnospiraceae bacterium]
MNKFLKDNKYAALGLTAFFVIIASALFVFIIFNFGLVLEGVSKVLSILTPIIDGFALAYVLTPLLNYIEREWIGRIYAKSGKEMTVKRKKARRSWSIIVTYIIFIGLLIFFFRLVIPQLINSIKSIIYQFPRYINNLEVFVTELFDDYPEVETEVNSFITEYSIQLNDMIQNKVIPQAEDIIRVFSLSVINVVKAMFNLIVGFIISLYLMSTKERFAGQAKKIVYALYDTKEANKMISGVRYSHSVFVGFLGGKIVDSVIIGILCFVITRLVNIPYAVLVSVIVGVTNIIPFFGPFIGGIPSVLLVLMIDPLKAFYLFIIVLVLQQLDGNIIGPKILGDSTGLSSFWVIFSITIFGGLFGIAGMILGVPTFAVIYAFIRYKVNRRLRHKSLPQDTKPYINVGSIEKDGSFIDYVPVKGRSFFQIIGLDKRVTKKPDFIKDDDNEEDSIKENNIIEDNTGDQNSSTDAVSDGGTAI